MAVICASVKRAELLEPGDVVNVDGSGFTIEHVSVHEGLVSLIRKEGGKVVRMPSDHQIEYVTAEQWAAL